MSFDKRTYNRLFMRKVRAKEHQVNLVGKGKCPITEILLDSRYHDPDCVCGFHPVIDVMKQEVSLRIRLRNGVYDVTLIKDGKELPFETYFVLQEGHYFETGMK